MKFLATIAIVFICSGLFGQSTFSLGADGGESSFQNFLIQPGFKHHGMILPVLIDDSLRLNELNNRKSVADYFWNKTTFTDNSAFNVIALPLVAFNYEKHSEYCDSTVTNASIGAMLTATYKNKFTVYGDFLATKGTYNPYLLQRFDSLGIIPGFGMQYNNSPGKIYYENINFYLSWTPNEFINLQAGQGKNFWGNGYRSLFLSDVSTNYPFLKFTTTFWHIKYISLFTQLKDIRNHYDSPKDYFTKYATMHFISWNLTKRINVNIFESVIWQAKDTLQNRQFDVNYLNPVIFFRPVEYSLGSSDNSIMGMGLNFKFFKKSLLYSQFILDEFVLDKIKQHTGWWANKYGIQVGGKAYDAFKIKGLYLQTEYNVVRPYTYSHGSIYQNYAHFNQPLAHPMGANFRDWVTIVNYTYKWIKFTNKLVIANYGTDTSSINYGGNLYQSYSNRPYEYHHFIGQGLNNELMVIKTGLEFLLLKQNNLRLEIGYQYRKFSNKNQSIETPFIYFTIRTSLYQLYNDF